MECFIKKVWEDKAEEAHYHFVRFGKGQFKNRAVLNLQKIESSGKIKIRGSFEYANDFVNLVSELNENAKFSGIILSKKEISELRKGKKKTGIFEYSVEEISSLEIKNIKDKIYVMLLDAKTPNESLKLKIKKRLPKPGKSGKAKIDDKFCQLETEIRCWDKIKEAFMLPECKKCKVSHTFVINEIVFPEGEKDFAKIREMSKRKGKIIRKLEVDKEEKKEEKNFEA